MSSHHKQKHGNSKRKKKKEKERKRRLQRQQAKDDMNGKMMTTFKGERLRGKLTEISALKNSFMVTTFLKHLIIELSTIFSLPFQLYCDGIGFTALLGAFPFGSCVRAKYFSGKCCPSFSYKINFMYFIFDVAQNLAVPFFIVSCYVLLNNNTRQVPDPSNLSAIILGAITFFFCYLVRVVAICVKYATQPSRAYEAMRRKPRENISVWSSWLIGGFKNWSSYDIFQRINISMTLDGIPTNERTNRSFDLRFGSHNDAKNYVNRLLQFLFPKTIPKLKYEVTECLEKHNFLSSMEISKCRKNYIGEKFECDANKNIYNVRVPAILIAIPLILQENIGRKRNVCIRFLIQLGTISCTLLPPIIVYLFDRPIVYFSGNPAPSNSPTLECLAYGNQSHSIYNQTSLLYQNATLYRSNLNSFSKFFYPGPNLIQFYYCLSYDATDRLQYMIIWITSIILSMPLLFIDLSFIQAGAAAYFRQYHVLRHLDSAIAPSKNVTVLDENDRCGKMRKRHLNRIVINDKECKSSNHLVFVEDLPLIQMTSISNVESYLMLRRSIRNLYSNVFERAQVIMLTYTAFMAFLVLYLLLVVLRQGHSTHIVTDFLLHFFFFILTGVSLLLSYIYAQSKANQQTDTASRAFLHAQVSFESLYRSIVGDENVNPSTIDYMRRSLKTGRTMFLETARKMPHTIFGLKADTRLLTQIGVFCVTIVQILVTRLLSTLTE